jgi:hypothetical protein
MSRKDKKKKLKLAPFTAWTHSTADTPAWRATSHGAKVLYMNLKRRYRYDRENAVYLSERDAHRVFRSDRKQISRWFDELAHYGFIVMVSPGCLGLAGKGKSPHYRLTECRYMGAEPTREFLLWHGKRFRPEKQNPGGEITSTLVVKSPPPLGTITHKNGKGGGEITPIRRKNPGGEITTISRLPSSRRFAGGGQAQGMADRQTLGVASPVRRMRRIEPDDVNGP